jgi:hypothetical protein
MTLPLAGRIALVAGATRGAGRGIAVELGAAGATVYCTGRTTRTGRSEYDRPETIEETAEAVTAAGGEGIAVRVDHLERGNRERALTALNPSEGVLVIGSQVGSGVAQIGVRGLAAALDSAAIPTPAVARTPDLRVEVGLRERTGWFSAPIQFMTLAAGSEPQWLRVSGVFAQQKGEWKLVEIHLSKPGAAPATTRTDTTRRDSARPAQAPTAATDSPRRTSRWRG